MVEEAAQADGGVQPSPPERPLSGTRSAGSGKGDATTGSAGAGVSSKGKGQTGAESDGSEESGKGKGQTGAGSARSAESGKGARPQDVARATLAMKGIELPTKGQSKGQGQASKPSALVTLDSVTPTLIRMPPDRPTAGEPSRLLSRPRPEATAAAAPPPVGTDPSSLPRSARQDANADTLSVRLDEIMERLQVLEQRSVEILNLLRAHPRLSSLD